MYKFVCFCAIWNLFDQISDPILIFLTMENIEFDDIQEVIMDYESDAELEEETENVLDSDKEAIPEEDIGRFRTRRPEDTGNRLNFTPSFVGINKNAAPNISADSSPLNIFILFFEEIFRIILLESNKYYEQYYDNRNTPGPSTPHVKITLDELYTFFALVIQMGHDMRDALRDYWRKEEQYYTPFYHNILPRDRFLHILKFLHFSDNNDAPNREAPDYDRLWKIRKIFDILNEKYSELYYPEEHIAVDEVIVLFKGRVVFRQYIPKKHKRFGIKIYKLNDTLGYTYDMQVYLGKQKEAATKNISAVHGTVLGLTRKVEGVGHKLYMDNYFSSPALYDDLLTRKINSCGTVRYNRRELPQEINPKNLKLKKAI